MPMLQGRMIHFRTPKKSAAERGKSANPGSAEAGRACLQAGTAREASNFVASYPTRAIKPYDCAYLPDHVPAGAKRKDAVAVAPAYSMQPILTTSLTTRDDFLKCPSWEVPANLQRQPARSCRRYRGYPIKFNLPEIQIAPANDPIL
jgi:tetraacyldisaccharide-1-P 4'-kinase